MLIGKGLTKSYQSKDVLREVDVVIESGKITSLIGPSGSGKTTLLQVLSMLELPDMGSISLEDAVYTFPKDKEKNISPWPKISVVFQQLFLWPHLTLRENILLPLKNCVDEQLADELISIFQMEGFVDRYPNQVSIGQRQRAAIARAIVVRPKYLLLDEITSALDIEQVEIVLNYLATLKEKGVGILLVSHALHFAENVSDKIIFLDQGSILETGGKEVLQNPKHPRVQKFLSAVKLAS